MSQAPVYVGNIGAREKRKRKAIAWVSFVVAAIGYGVLVWLGTARIWRVTLFMPLWLAFLAWFEARGAT